MPKAQGKSEKTFWAPLKTTIKAYAKQQAMKSQKLTAKARKPFGLRLKQTIKAYAKQQAMKC
jgi:siderophore synthetase component